MGSLNAQSLTETVVAHCPPLEGNSTPKASEEEALSDNANDDSLIEDYDERGLLSGHHRRGRNPVERWKYNVMRDGKEHLYMCTACGIRYKHRKSLNKHWRDKHNYTVEPPALLPQENLAGRKRVFSEVAEEDEDEEDAVPASKRPINMLSSEDHEGAVRFLSTNGQALSKFVRVALTQHPDLRAILPECPPAEADRPPVLSPQVPTESTGRDEVDGPLDLTLMTGEMPVVTQAPMDLSGAKVEPSLSTSAFTRVLAVKNSSAEALTDVKEEGGEMVKRKVPDENTAPEIERRGLHPGERKPPKSPVRCFQCSEECQDLEELDAHFKGQHLRSLVAEMESGKRTLALTEAELDQARASVDGNNQCTFVCPAQGCNYYSKWPTDLQKHAKTHISTRNEVCLVCGKSYKWKWDLGRHFENTHKQLPNPYKKGSPPSVSNNMPSADVNRLISDLSSQLEAIKQACGLNSSSPTSRRLPQRPTFDNYHGTPVQAGPLLTELIAPPARSPLTPSIPPSAPLVSAPGTPVGSHFLGAMHSQSFSTPTGLPASYVQFNAGRAQELFHSQMTPQPPQAAPQPVQKTSLQLPLQTEQKTPNVKQPLPPVRRRTIAVAVPTEASQTGDVVPPKLTKETLFGQVSPASSKEQLHHYQPHCCPHPNCDFRARWASELKSHMLNHSDFRPYGCPFCVYKSKWKWDTVKHIKRCATNHNQALPESNREIMSMMRVYKCEEESEDQKDTEQQQPPPQQQQQQLSQQQHQIPQQQQIQQQQQLQQHQIQQLILQKQQQLQAHQQQRLSSPLRHQQSQHSQPQIQFPQQPHVQQTTSMALQASLALKLAPEEEAEGTETNWAKEEVEDEDDEELTIDVGTEAVPIPPVSEKTSAESPIPLRLTLQKCGLCDFLARTSDELQEHTHLCHSSSSSSGPAIRLSLTS